MSLNLSDKEQNCIPTDYPCHNGQCVNLSLVCDFSFDCSDGSDEFSCPSTCNFEDNSFCGWNIKANQSYTWSISLPRNTTQQNSLLPDTDQTGSKFGHFLMLTPDGGPETSMNAVITSNLYHNTNGYCTFEYYYYRSEFLPSDIDLTIHLLGADTTFPIMLFTADNSEGVPVNEWVHDMLEIGRQRGAFKLSFSAKGATTTDQSVFALDSFKFSGCQMYDRTDSSGCSASDRYFCKNTKVSTKFDWAEIYSITRRNVIKYLLSI